MKITERRIPTILLTALAFALAGVLGYDAGADTPGGKTMPPLVIKEQGSFFVGGEVLNRGSNDDVTINQMYVQFQIPLKGANNVPVIMTHGCCLSSKTWETTPDGRMGWAEYFLRKGYPVYLTDQSGRARSGFNATVYNQVRTGELPPDSQPLITHASHQLAWAVFRFGPFNEPFPDQQFPTEAVDELYKQMIPDLTPTLPADNPSLSHLAALAGQLGGAVLVGHSQSGHFPFEAALRNPGDAKGLVLIEGFCNPIGGITDGQLNFIPRSQEEINALAKTPILTVFGDHLADNVSSVPLGVRPDYWQTAFDDCNVFIDRINAAGGNATMLYPPAMGILGNSHMLMQDRNSLELADMILKWITENVQR